MNIYVGNLNYRVREDDLKQVMEEYGTVESVKIIKDREAGRSIGRWPVFRHIYLLRTYF